MHALRPLGVYSCVLLAGSPTAVFAQAAATARAGPPDPGALLDMNTDQPLPDMSKNRQGELTALTSPRFSAALQARHVVLLTYRDLIAREGLKSMRRPVE
jgi:hypothetical protein